MGLMDWYFNNIERASDARASGMLNAQARQRAAGAEQVQSIMGSPAAGPPDMYGQQPQAATGLMGADQNDPMSFINAGAGLMQIPGYEQFANTFLGQAISNQLGRPHQAAQLQEQQRYHNAQINMKMLERQQELNQRVGPYADLKAYGDVANMLQDDATKAVQPYRDSIELYNSVNSTIGKAGGFSNMNIVGDELLMKGYAKMLLPKEAVMTDDMGRISMTDDVNSVVRGMANSINLGIPLSETQRYQLWSEMNNLMTSKLSQYNEERRFAEQRAQRLAINPADVLRKAIEMDVRQFEKPGFSSSSTSNLSEEENRRLTELADQEQGKEFSITDPDTWFR